MIKDLSSYLRKVKKINLRQLERTVTSKVIDSSKKIKTHEIKIRENPAFFSKARISIKRELRPLEIKRIAPKTMKSKCVFCNPKIGFAGFDPKLKLKPEYHLNDSVVFSNLYPTGKIHGLIIHTKNHVVDARQLKIRHWADSIKLVQKIGKMSKKKYVSYNVNHGTKAGASIEHFHGQFHCEDVPLSKTLLSMKLTKKLGGTSKKWWLGWIKSMLSEGLVLDFDSENKVVMFVEWSPAFGKTEIVVMTMETSAFQSMSDGEVETVARYLKEATTITSQKISEQYNILNLSASSKDDYCSQFRIISRAPLSDGTKSWEGYLEFLGETVPHIDPKKLVKLAKQI